MRLTANVLYHAADRKCSSACGRPQMFFSMRPTYASQSGKPCTARAHLLSSLCIKHNVPLYSFLYSDECSFHHRQVLQLIRTSLAIEKFFYEKPSERYHGPVFMLERRGLMVFRCSDNIRDILEPGSGGKAVSKWDNTCPRQTPRGL